MKLKDIKQIVTLLGNEWDLGKKSSGSKKNVCAWIYFCEIMSESEKLIIEKINNKIIGVCGYTKKNSKKYKLRKMFYKTLKHILLNSYLIQNKKAMLDYLESYDYTPEELKNYFDGELSIIIVDKKYRNCGIGKKLINNIFEYAKKDNIKKIQILTDESCNYKFYENLGCKKIYEKTITIYEPNKNSNKTEKGYIYEKRL